MTRKRKPNRPRLERVSVRGELRDEPDWDRFAWALLQHARLLNQQADEHRRESR
jgi:hypothetical protein